MLTLLKIRNIALIDQLDVEFGTGLNVLTGETGSGKSIIVDSLGALTGDRLSADLIKQGETSGRIEGIFATAGTAAASELDANGLDTEGDALIVRRELSVEGRNRVFMNDQLITQALLKRIGAELVDIHGQGEHTSLYRVATHAAMLDDYAGTARERAAVADAYSDVAALRAELADLSRDEAEKLQLLDILRFQVDEIRGASLAPGEDIQLEDEKRRLNNVEKLSALSAEAHSLLYEDDHSTLATLDRAARIVAELAAYDERFRGFDESLESARATVSELGTTARDFAAAVEFSPDRINEIEQRIAEISRLKRKYGDSIDAVLGHLADAESRLTSIETAEEREAELQARLNTALERYRGAAGALNSKRVAAAKKFSRQVEKDLGAVALERARFEVKIEDTGEVRLDGADRIEFFFSANPGEPPRPLASIASGGEASRLMLILKTVTRAGTTGKTAVFDEIDVGIGGRVAEAVGRRLKDLAGEQQVFCVTHQPQIAALADRHFVVEKTIARGRTSIGVRELEQAERIEELARMLAGEHITDQARDNARAMLASAT